MINVEVMVQENLEISILKNPQNIYDTNGTIKTHQKRLENIRKCFTRSKLCVSVSLPNFSMPKVSVLFFYIQAFFQKNTIRLYATTSCYKRRRVNKTLTSNYRTKNHHLQAVRKPINASLQIRASHATRNTAQTLPHPSLPYINAPYLPLPITSLQKPQKLSFTFPFFKFQKPQQANKWHSQKQLSLPFWLQPSLCSPFTPLLLCQLQLLHQPPLPPGSILPWARSLSQPSCLSSLDTDSRSEGATWSLETGCGFEIYLATRVFTGGEYRVAQ